MILAGHGVIVYGAMDEVMAFAEKTNIPVAVTLLGIGGFPAEHPLVPRHDGDARRRICE